jgi:predicted phosphodiesterase
MLTIAGAARLVSDLHLRRERPDLTRRFATFLADTAASNVDTLFILGDLFEYWIGDDDLTDSFNAEVCALLRGTVDRGTRICFMAGNRDFLIGERFATVAGVRLLPETAKVGAGETAILLLHGDTLCTDDPRNSGAWCDRHSGSAISSPGRWPNAASRSNHCAVAAPRPSGKSRPRSWMPIPARSAQRSPTTIAPG